MCCTYLAKGISLETVCKNHVVHIVLAFPSMRSRLAQTTASVPELGDVQPLFRMLEGKVLQETC